MRMRRRRVCLFFVRQLAYLAKQLFQKNFFRRSKNQQVVAALLRRALCRFLQNPCTELSTASVDGFQARSASSNRLRGVSWWAQKVPSLTW